MPKRSFREAGEADLEDSAVGFVQVQVSRKLQALPHTRALAFDPDAEYLAAVSASGVLQIWDAMEGEQVHQEKGLAPKVLFTST